MNVDLSWLFIFCLIFMFQGCVSCNNLSDINDHLKTIEVIEQILKDKKEVK